MEIELYYKCPNCQLLTKINEADMEFTGWIADSCESIEISLVTSCQCGSIIECLVYAR